MGRPDPLTRLGWRAGALVAAGAVTLGFLGGCAITADPGGSPGVVPAPSSTPAARTATPSADTEPPAPARDGTTAPSQVDRFVPTELVLPGRSKAKVVPVVTADGELQVPKHVDDLGWWDGSAWLGDPFGSTVIAGHVDSATEGLGFFARLLRIEKGQRVTLRGAKGQQQTYEVTSVRTVAQNALASDSRALTQTGDHRLVLITCTGSYRPGRGYSSNLVVTAKQVPGAEK